jgi:hypothetical protein
MADLLIARAQTVAPPDALTWRALMQALPPAF